MSAMINDKGERIVASLKLKAVNDKPSHFIATYEGKHSNSKTTLVFDVILKLNKHSGGFTSSININDDCGGETPEESLKKLGRWLSRMGEALLHVQETTTLPYEMET